MDGELSPADFQKLADMQEMQSLAEKMRDKRYRDTYVAAHTREVLARQVRNFRGDESQAEFGELLGKRQTVVSRLENPSYGAWTLRTMFEVARKLNVAVFARFVDFPTFIRYSQDISDGALRPESYDTIKTEQSFLSIDSQIYDVIKDTANTYWQPVQYITDGINIDPNVWNATPPISALKNSYYTEQLPIITTWTYPVSLVSLNQSSNADEQAKIRNLEQAISERDTEIEALKARVRALEAPTLQATTFGGQANSVRAASGRMMTPFASERLRAPAAVLGTAA